VSEWVDQWVEQIRDLEPDLPDLESSTAAHALIREAMNAWRDRWGFFCPTCGHPRGVPAEDLPPAAMSERDALMVEWQGFLVRANAWRLEGWEDWPVRK
jgi:hypothetical protein